MVVTCSSEAFRKRFPNWNPTDEQLDLLHTIGIPSPKLGPCSIIDLTTTLYDRVSIRQNALIEFFNQGHPDHPIYVLDVEECDHLPGPAGICTRCGEEVIKTIQLSYRRDDTSRTDWEDNNLEDEDDTEIDQPSAASDNPGLSRSDVSFYE